MTKPHWVNAVKVSHMHASYLVHMFCSVNGVTRYQCGECEIYYCHICVLFTHRQTFRLDVKRYRTVMAQRYIRISGNSRVIGSRLSKKKITLYTQIRSCQQRTKGTIHIHEVTRTSRRRTSRLFRLLSLCLSMIASKMLIFQN